ncbi:cytochrome P450 [Aspergillus pseudonomiae]|nr:cytochrome P450 [Aspergillus pseudonomiae]
MDFPTVIKFLIGLTAGRALYCFLVSLYREFQADTVLARQHACEPPPELPTRWPLGLDRIKQLWTSNAEGHLLAFLCSVAEEYEPGNTLSQYLLLGPRAFHILRPENVEAILSTHSEDYGLGARREVFAPLLGNGIFTQEGPAWRHSRDLLGRQFSRIKSRSMEHLHEHVDNLIARVPLNAVVDLQPLFFDLTLDITTSLLFGKSVYSLKADINQDSDNMLFTESFNIAQEGLAKRFCLAPFHWLYNPPKFRRACADVHRFVEHYIDGLKLDLPDALNDEACSFIKQLAQESISKTDLRDQLLNVLWAGRDTTACCLSWMLRLLIRNEHVMYRLRDEASSIMGQSQYPSRDQMGRIPYLNCVIRETLRLYPSVPLNNREAKQTTILPTGGGENGHSPILVRKGELVVFSQYVNSRKRNIYGPDADVFRPERWETGELGQIGWAYFPFNGGPRQCLIETLL